MRPIVLEIAGSPLEAVVADLAVVPVFAEDRPLPGAAGRADWRLCGALSRLYAAGHLSGTSGEAALVPSGGGIAAPCVMALGLGSRAEFGDAALARFTVEAVHRAAKLRASNLALGWPERIAVPGELQVEALLSGLDRASASSEGVARVWLCASASEAAVLAQALRRRELPRGVVLGAPLAAADPSSPIRPASPGIASIARIRFK
ncbi:MAG TPA: M17 family peptidase N-terminal domain-containing protein [Myxococcota bacterium]|nr:M17 family peptidase N-terminal domain-containing protein [Myxococcota bacterium]